MQIRSLLLRSLLVMGGTLAFTMSHSALAAEPNADAAGILVAQADCPEGQECPPKKQKQEQKKEKPKAEEPAKQEQPSSEEPKAKKSTKKKDSSSSEETETKKSTKKKERSSEEPAATKEQPSSEESAPKKRAKTKEQPTSEEPEASEPEEEQPAASEEPKATKKKQKPAPEEPTGEEPAPEKAEPGAEEGTPEGTLERAQRRQKELQRGEQPQEEQPADAEKPPAEEQPAEEQAGGDGERTREQPTTVEEIVPKDGSTAEKQLKAQGDEEGAERIRSLRKKLFEARRAAEAATEEAEEARRDRDGRRRDGDWWDAGRGKVLERRGDRIIVDIGDGKIIVRSIIPDEGDRFLDRARDVDVDHLRGGRTRTVVYRENGSRIVTIRDRYGDIIRRVKVTPDGHEIVLIYNHYEDDRDVVFVPVILPPPIIEIPEEEYIVDYGHASYDEVYGALIAPPVQPLERGYTLAEVTESETLRDYVPRIDLDTITFEFGSATIGPDQMQALAALGQAMQQVLAERPDEVYLIEGHTDAVGSETDNLVLSDQRAEAVAVALSQNFDIPPENLVTEGYGEQYLKVDTEGPSEENRRVTVRRITELMAARGQGGGEPPPPTLPPPPQ